MPGQDSKATERQALLGSHAPFEAGTSPPGVRRPPTGPGKDTGDRVDQCLGQEAWNTLRYQPPLKRSVTTSG
jgi:hypothetical protein